MLCEEKTIKTKRSSCHFIHYSQQVKRLRRKYQLHCNIKKYVLILDTAKILFFIYFCNKIYYSFYFQSNMCSIKRNTMVSFKLCSLYCYLYYLSILILNIFYMSIVQIPYVHISLSVLHFVYSLVYHILQMFSIFI